MTAGAELAACGGNNQALHAFGLEWIHKHEWLGSLARLHELGLPIFTSPSSNDLLETDHLISSLLPKGQSPHRRLVMASDRTYLATSTQLCQTTRGHVLLGGRHVPPGFSSQDESQRVLKDPDGNVVRQVACRARQVASEVECLVVWDPTRGMLGHQKKLFRLALPDFKGLVCCFAMFCMSFGSLQFGKPRHSPMYEAAAYPCMPNAEKHEDFEIKATCARL